MKVLVVGGIFREVLDADTSPHLRYGGSGLAASVAAARFGARVALASYVGAEDEAAVRSELQLAGVDDRAVLSVPGASGTFAFPAHEVDRRPWPMYRPAESLPHEVPLVPSADMVLAFGIPDCDPVRLGWLGTGGNYGTVIWDRQGWLSNARDAGAILQIEGRRRIYLANELEAIEDAQVGSVNEALLNQPPRGFDVAVVKRGEDGVVVVGAEKVSSGPVVIPAFWVNARTTIGSGDVFAGAFAASLASGIPPVMAAQWGCAAAAISLRASQNLLAEGSYAQARELIVACRKQCVDY